MVSLFFDPYAQLRLADLVLPFGAAYRPLWLGLGTLAADVMFLIVATSLLRSRIGVRVWRTVHWLSYGLWPAAWLHGFFTGSDSDELWLRLVAIACVLAVAAAGDVALRARIRRGLPVTDAPPTRARARRRGRHPMTHHAAAPGAPGAHRADPEPRRGCAGHRRLLFASAPDLAEHERQHGAPPWHGGTGRLTATVEAAGLTGRGGSGFPDLAQAGRRGQGAPPARDRQRRRGRAGQRQGPGPAGTRAPPGPGRPAARGRGGRRQAVLRLRAPGDGEPYGRAGRPAPGGRLGSRPGGDRRVATGVHLR